MNTYSNIYIYCIIYHIHLDPMTPSVFAVLRWTSGRCVAGSAESQALQLGWQWSCWVPWLSCGMPSSYNAHMLHVWYSYLQNWVIYGANVGKYSIHGAYGMVYQHRHCKYHHQQP